jgi:hypothetical protein
MSPFLRCLVALLLIATPARAVDVIVNAPGGGGGGGGGHVIQDEGTPLTARPTLNFVGAGITCGDSPGTTATICNVLSGADTIIWGAGLAVTGTTARTDSTEAQFLNNGGATDLTGGAGQFGKAQVMADGTFQYTDGSPTPQLRRGFLTQSGISWNVTAGTCTSDPNSGKLTVNGANQIICASDQGGGGAGTGDISAVGSCATGDCFTAATPSATLFVTAAAAPSTPTAGSGVVYFDITAKNLAVKDDAGVVKHGVQTKTATASQWLNSIADNGVVTSTQPASTDLSDSASVARLTTAQTFTQSRVNPRILNAGTGSPISNINSDLHDQVHIVDLAGPTTFDVPLGSPTNGQWLTMSIYTPTARTLTFSNATGGFSGENGYTVPTSSIAGAYLVLQWRWNTLSSRWGLAWSSRSDFAAVQLTNALTIVGPVGGIIDCNSMSLGYLTALSQNSTFPAPSCTPRDGQMLLYRIISASPQGLTWDNAYSGSAGIPLPSTTTGGGVTDVFGFKRNGPAAKWELIASTQNSLSARRRTCAIVIGDDVATSPALTDAQLTNQFDLCLIPSTATVEEITIKADAGTPNVVVHRRTSAGSVTPLLSSALATAASGALACARPTAVAGYAGTTCAATLQNSTIGAGDWLGLTSGTAGGTARRFSIMVSYLLGS